MPTVALIGPELFPIPPIRGGATELFIDRLAAHLSRYQPVVMGPADPELPDQEMRGRVAYQRVPLNAWQKWLYRRYRHLVPLYDRGVAKLVRRLGPDLLHVHNRPLLALNLKTWFPRLPVLLHMHNTYHILGKRERPAPYTPMPVEAFLACSNFVMEEERDRLCRCAFFLPCVGFVRATARRPYCCELSWPEYGHAGRSTNAKYGCYQSGFP